MPNSEFPKLQTMTMIKGMTTTERDALSTPVTGISGCTLIYNKTTSKLNFYDGRSWVAVTSA